MASYYNYSSDEDDHEKYDEDALPERDEGDPVPVIYTDKNGFVNLLEVSNEEAQAALRNYQPDPDHE